MEDLTVNNSVYKLTFPKSERLRHKTLVDTLFENGNKKFEYPVRVMYKAWSEEELKNSFKIALPDKMAPLQVVITIPKRKIRHAVDRVKLRRRIREAWRLNRRELRKKIEDSSDIRLLGVGIVYMTDEVLSMERIEYKIKLIISMLCEKIENIKVD